MVKNPALAIPSRQRKPVMKAILLRLLWTTEREAGGWAGGEGFNGAADHLKWSRNTHQVHSASLQDTHE